MSLCGAAPLLDQRSCRIDIATTLGEPVEWTIDFGEDVSGWTFSAGLINPDGTAADVDPPNPPEPLVLDTSAAATGVITLSVTGLATTEEPLGTGHWTWWLAAIVPPGTEASYLLGGDLGIYSVSSFASQCADTNQVIEVSVGPPTIDADVSLFLPGGDASGFVQKSGDTMTGALSLDNSSGLFVKNEAVYGADHFAKLNWAAIGGTTGGGFYLQVEDGVLSGPNRSVMVVSPEDEMITFAPGSVLKVAVPEPDGAKQAAQVSAYDATTGQLAIGGNEVGDTGWLDVGADLINDWTAIQFWTRRVGNVVHVAAQGLNGGTDNSVWNHNAPEYTGFQPGGPGATAGRVMVMDLASTVYRSFHTGNVWSISGAASSPSSFYFATSWVTDEAWPVSLPGIVL